MPPEEIIVTEDINFHLGLEQDQNSQKFLQSLHEHGLKQLIDKPTHVRGHILNTIVTRDNCHVLQFTPIVDDHYIYNSRGVSSYDPYNH